MKLAIISGKGGSGKSSITASFISLARQVVAIDCDVDASNLPLLFPHQIIEQENFVSGQQIKIDPARCIGCGVCMDSCAFHAIRMSEAGIAVANDLLCESCGLCPRLCPCQAISITEEAKSLIYTSRFESGIMVHGDLYPGDDNSGKMIARLRQIGDRVMSDHDISLQILDGPPGIGCPVLSTVTGMDKVIIVSEPTLSGMSDLQRAYRVASSFCKEILVAINKCDINDANRNRIKAYCKEQDVPVIMELPFDRKLVEAQLHRESIITYAPESECTQILKETFNECINSSIPF